MGLDGGFLHLLTSEMSEKLAGARVDKIQAPSKDELVLVVRSKGFSGRFYVTCRTGSARMHFIGTALENPAEPPMFCMLLRKYLTSARITGIEQPGLERVVFVRFETSTELGDRSSMTLVCELFGRLPNLILLDTNGHIVDAVRRINAESSYRVILPGARYELPAPQDKISLLEKHGQDVLDAMDFTGEQPLDKALSKVLDGASPVVCREIAYKSLHGRSLMLSEMGEEEKERLRFFLDMLSGAMQGESHPTLVMDKLGKPLDFSYTELTQYGLSGVTRPFSSCTDLIEAFHAESDRNLRLHRRTQDILKLLTRTVDRVNRRVLAQRQELIDCKDRERLREFGELIKANLHTITNRQDFCEVVDYYNPECPVVRIPMDIRLNPSANAQRYFKEYRKSHTAEQMLTRLISEGENEITYLESVFDALSRCETERDVKEIKEELRKEGYLKREKGKGQKPVASKPLERISDDGFRILIGRNNRQNEELSLRIAKGSDIWLHVKNQPGAHVLVICDGKTPPDETVEFAASLAAGYSKAAGSGQVAVDMTMAKFVRKQAGGKTGMVIYDHQKTIYVLPFLAEDPMSSKM